MKFFEEKGCVVISNNETSESRIAILKKGVVEFELWHDDLFGNYIVTNNLQDVTCLKELANSVVSAVMEVVDNAKFTTRLSGNVLHVRRLLLGRNKK